MKVELLDIIIIIITFQLLVFSIFLFTRKARQMSNYLLGIQLFSQSAGIFNGFCMSNIMYFIHNAPAVFFTGYPFFFLWGPTFYLYVKSVSFNDFKLKPLNILHLLPFIAVTLFLIFTFYLAGEETKKIILASGDYPLIKYSNVVDIFIRFQVLFYIIASWRILKKLKENYSSISKTNLSWIWYLVSGFTISYFITVPFILYADFTRVYNRDIYLLIFTPYFIYFNIIFYKAWYHPEIFSGVEEIIKYKSSRLSKEEADKWIIKIDGVMKSKKPYLNPSLTIKQLSEELDISPRILSQIVNEYFGQNFYDYINKIRIEESKKMLSDTGNKKTILEILYEAGFNSKTAFNLAFKKTTGFTPTEYRKNAEKTGPGK